MQGPQHKACLSGICVSDRIAHISPSWQAAVLLGSYSWELKQASEELKSKDTPCQQDRNILERLDLSVCFLKEHSLQRYYCVNETDSIYFPCSVQAVVTV